MIDDLLSSIIHQNMSTLSGSQHHSITASPKRDGFSDELTRPLIR
jgi:hypothetical protein